MLSFLSVEARRVDVEKAGKVARSYARTTSQLSSRKDFRLSKTVTKRVARQRPAVKGANSPQQDEPVFYVFAMNGNGGFIIVSGDDVAKPVLGYSGNGTYDENNPNLAYWMETLSQEIVRAIENDTPQDELIKAQWAAFENDKPLRASGDYVAPLVKTQWDQWDPYNNLCPEISGTRALTGCVATAMAQIMKYHEYPKTRTAIIDGYRVLIEGIEPIVLPSIVDPTTYDWKNMTYTYSSSSKPVENDAVATLMYHCGVSVKMKYNTGENGGSGAYSANVMPALDTCFGYDKGMTERFRNNCSNTEWIALLKTEIKAGRPVYYDGQNSSGDSRHAFVCDGYDSDDKFHFNWGWGGRSDGYFEVSALNPEVAVEGTDGYNHEQLIITGIQPDVPLVDAQTPVITAQPQSADYAFGATATALSVTANVADGGILSYQWYSNTSESNTGGTEIIGATSSICTPPVTATGTIYYYVTVTNTNTGANITGAQTVSITSSVATVAVTKASQSAPDAALAGITSTSVTLTAVSGAEYSMDGENWQDSPTFDGLIPGASYTFYARMKETDTHNTSAASAGLTVHTISGTEADLENLTVNGNPVSISGNELDYQTECDETSVRLDIEPSTAASVTVTLGNDSIKSGVVLLSGDLTVVNIKIVSGDTKKTNTYRLTVVNPLDAGSVLYQRWNDVLAVNSNPANNGGRTVEGVRWYAPLSTNVITEQFIPISGEAKDYRVEIKIAGKWHNVCGTPEKHSKLVAAYPNPVSIGENLTLQLPGNFTGGYMNVIGLSGSTVKHKLPLPDAVNTVSVADWAPGIYLLNIVAPNGTQELVKIIVSN
jgi:hypothetical protein